MKISQLSSTLFVVIMLACASRPWWLPVPHKNNALSVSTEQNWAFSHWHTSHQQLYILPLSALEQKFAANFPGQIARFTDGRTIWVIRHTVKPTRMLHSAIDCYRGLGYQVIQTRIIEDQQHQRWRCFNAVNGQSLQVCERIFDAQDKQWTDVSAWYWENLFKQRDNEWWAITQVSSADHTY
jgi:hypothetical protein